MEESALVSKWNELSDWLFELTKSGHAGAVLGPLASQPDAALAIVRTESESEDYTHRKLAACLAGYLQTDETSLLESLFEKEAVRDARLPPDNIERLYCQSVVEDIVFAATRWCWREASREPALSLLRKVVERTIDGEYWNTSSYAIVALCKYDPRGSDSLLRRFDSYARTAKIEHPSRPTLKQEREFAEGLINRNRNTLNAIDNLLKNQDAVAAVARFDPESHRAIVNLLAVAGGSYTAAPASPEQPPRAKRGFWGKLFRR